MNAISEAVQNLDAAINILDQHANNPQNYNDLYAIHFEKISWEIYRQMNEIKDISNRYGVL